MVTVSYLRSIYPGSLASLPDAQIEDVISLAADELDATALGSLYDRILVELSMYYLTTTGSGFTGSLKSESVSGSAGGGSTSRSVSVGSQEDSFHWQNYQRLLRRAIGITATLSF